MTTPDLPPIATCRGCGNVSVLDVADLCALCAEQLDGYRDGRAEAAEAMFVVAARVALASGVSFEAMRAAMDAL